MIVFRRTLAVLMATSAVVCGCSCSPKGGGGSNDHAAVTGPDSSKTLTTAEAAQIKGRFLGSLTAAPGSEKLADVALTVSAAGAASSSGLVSATNGADPVWSAKLEVSNANLNTTLISKALVYDSKTGAYSTRFTIQSPSLARPLELKMNFKVAGGHLQGTLADDSQLSALVTGRTPPLGASATVTEQSSPERDLTDADVRGHKSFRPTPAVKPAPVEQPATPPSVNGSVILDLALDANQTALPVIDSKHTKTPVALYYSGTTNFINGGSKPVDFVIQEPDTTSDGALYALVAAQGLDQKFVTTVVNYGSGAKLEFAPGLLDAKTGQLNAVSFLGRSARSTTSAIEISCVVKARRTLDCSHLSDGNSVAQTHLEQVAALSKSQPQAGDPRSVTNIYKGLARFEADRPTAVDLDVSYDESSSLDSVLSLLQPSAPHSKTLKLTFYVTGSVSGVRFPDVNFDEKTQRLTGSTSFVLHDTDVTASIVCNGFTFGAADSRFSCVYTNSMLAAPVPFQFPVK